MMKMKEFMDAVEARNAETGTVFEMKEIQKNNDTVRLAVQIREQEYSAAKVLYVDDLKEKMDSGAMSAYEAAKEFTNRVRYASGIKDEQVKMFVYGLGKGKDFILKNVRRTVVNKKWNMEQLQQLVHRDYLDLTVIYEVTNSSEGTGNMSVKVTNAMAENCGITAEELEQAARKNERKYIVRNMVEMLLSMMPEGSFERELMEEQLANPGEQQQYVIGTENGLKGAAAILDIQLFEDLAQKTGRNIWIIPSSIHELIAIPDNEKVNAEEITNMVQDVNTTQVNAEERLADHVYFYERGSMKITY